MKKYISYRRSPLRVYDKGWKIALYTLFASGLLMLVTPLIARLESKGSEIDLVWLLTGLAIMSLSFILFMIFICGARVLRRKLVKHSKETVNQIEIATSRLAQKNRNSAIEAFFDSAFNTSSKRDRKTATAVIKNYVDFQTILTTYTSTLRTKGIDIEEKQAINIIASIMSGKFVAFNVSDVALADTAIKTLSSLSIEVKELDFNEINSVEDLVAQLVPELGVEELRLMLLKNFTSQKQEIFAQALSLINIRYNDIELKYRRQNLSIPAHIVFAAIEKFDALKSFPKELRKAAFFVDVDLTKTTPTAEAVMPVDGIYDYLYRIDALKGTCRLGEEDWKMIDGLMNIQTEVKLSNKEYLEIERYLTVLGAFGLSSDMFKNEILAQRILPLIAPIISSTQDKEATKKLKQMIGNKNEALSNVLMDYTFEDNKVEEAEEPEEVDEIDEEPIEEAVADAEDQVEVVDE